MARARWLAHPLSWGTAILLLAAALRLPRLHSLPPGLSQDEVLNADIVENIRAGQHALFFREGFGHEPLYHYFAVPFQALLGDNVLSIRLPAVTLGLLLVALTIRWARRDYGAWAAATAGVVLALSWWAIVFSRIGLRPISEPVLLVVMAWLYRRRPLLAGVALGLVAYTYSPGWVMLALPLGLALLARIGRIQPPPPSHHLRVFAVAALVAAPLFVYLRLNPTLLERADQLSGPVTALLGGDFRPIVATVSATLGAFTFTGDPRWTYMLPGTPLFDWLVGLLFYGGVYLAIRKITAFRNALLLLWLTLALLPSAVTPDAPSTIRLIGALPVVAVLIGLTVQTVADASAARQQRWHPALPLLLVLLLGGVTLARTLTVHVDRWAHAFDTRVKYQTIFADMAEDMAARQATPVVMDGFFAPIDADSIRRNLNGDPQARWVQQGNAIVIPPPPALLYVPESDPIQPALAQAARLAPEPLMRQLVKPGFAVYNLPATLAPDRAVEPVTFGAAITLLGYTIGPPTAGQPLEVFTFWRVDGTLPDDAALFLQATGVDLAENAPIATQHDGLDAIPSTLQPGDLFVQRHPLPPPAALDTPYRLHLGVYQRTTGQRLPYGSPINDRLTLPESVTFQP